MFGLAQFVDDRRPTVTITFEARPYASDGEMVMLTPGPWAFPAIRPRTEGPGAAIWGVDLEET